MHDELGAAGLVEEALQHDAFLRRHRAERGALACDVIGELARGVFLQADVVHQPAQRRVQPGVALRTDAFGQGRAQARDALREFIGAPGCLAEPERNARRRALRILHAHAAGLDLEDAVARIAELEDVAGHERQRGQ